jgi:nucleotide-binding universal stress UspA family protein
MSRTILVPLDGSPFAEHALPVAIAIARRTGAALELITVDRAPVSWVVPEVPIVMDEVLPVQDGQRYLEELHERMPADIPVRLTTLNGRATPFLVRHITTSEPAMVVMSTHGRGGFSRLWLGSVADGVARQSPAPFLMIKPPPTEVDLSAARRFPRVLIPLDGSVAGEEILDQALVTFGVEDVEYTLMRVISPLAVEHQWDGDTTPVRRAETHPEALLRATAERMRARGAKVVERLEVADMPATAIVEVAEEIEARAIAMTTHARRGMSRFLMGSIADKVLRTAPCPVLLYHPTHEVVDVRRRVESARASAVPL